MASGKKRRLAFFLAAFLPLPCFLIGMPSRSASALAAWALGSDGILQLRTSVGADLKAFIQSADAERGLRIWIDFPGELSRPRKIPGNGPVRQVRLGKPYKGTTRLVFEFRKDVALKTSKLKLVGTSPDRWKLNLIGLPTRNLRRIGEGDLTAFSSNAWPKQQEVRSQVGNFSYLPSVPKGRYRVVIDPGHGGPDSGAVGISKLRETDVVLDVSLQVARLLEGKGIKVNLTRTSEVDLDLPPRVAIANKLKADVFVSIHANASRNNKRDVNGIETFYFSGYKGFNLSRSIQKQVLLVSPGSPDRGVRQGRFFVIRRTNMPASLVEIGFINGGIDGPRLATSSHRRKIAFAIATGILKYLQGVS